MAKARPLPRATASRPTARPEAPARSGWIKQSLITALALAASAVFLAQVIRPAGMLAAMFQYEYGALDPNGTRQPSGPANRPTWKTIYAELETALAEHPATPGRNAVSVLLNTLIKADRDKLTAEELARARQAAEADSDNFLSRVTYAVIVDSQSVSTDPAARYKAMQEIIERPPQPKSATLYIEPFTRKWEEILRPHFQRRDMSVRLAASMEHYEIEDQYEAFPLLRKRLSALSRSLRQPEMMREGDYVDYWFAHLMTRIMREEKDAGTILFCAEQTGKLDRSGSVDVRKLAEMRRDFRANAAHSPVDVLELWRTPAIDGLAWRWALGTLVGAGVFFACALGAAGVMALATFCGMIWKNGAASSPSKPTFPSRLLAQLRLAAPVIALAFIIGRRFALTGPYSPAYELVLAAACITIGAISAGWVTTSRPSAISLGCVFILFVGSMFVALSSPGIIAWQCRRIDMIAPSALVIFGVVACMIVVASIASPLDWRTMGRQATSAFAISACGALLAFQIHEAADRRYQETVIAHRLDELSARLGADWESKYLMELSPLGDKPQQK